MKQEVESFIRQHDLLQGGERVLLGVSGGPDSMAVLALFGEWQKTWHLHVEVVYVHHHLRAEAESEVAFVSEQAAARGMLFHVKHVYPSAGQMDARRLRYEAFEEQMTASEAEILVTAHHGDDQLETLLMQIIRGGVLPPAGMPVTRAAGSGRIIRPLLGVDKESIVSWLDQEGIPWREDSSNRSHTYQRNRLRSVVIPELKKENPKAHEAAGATAAAARREQEYLDACAAAWLDHVTWGDASAALSREQMKQVPQGLADRTALRLLQRLDRTAPWGRAHLDVFWEHVQTAAASTSRHLGHGWFLDVSYDDLHLRRAEETSNPFEERRLPEAGAIQLPGGSLVISREITPEAEKIAVTPDQMPLLVRGRRDGDRVEGKNGTKKLKKVMIDAKIPRKVRDDYPIITDRHGTILWVPFLFRKEAETTETPLVLYMTYHTHKHIH
ncbi:tRNA lysidine(34) synthetase TilS [Alkalicoccus chagannorensis]|uniref:tRNA lysidine(34) synthetase TilS n=1 Tax=Alkalicoccus chagannorensis TaxID=427072 RepID=UPI0004042826|nr:tRNA lysidine(34) synthetase TilS [Alkalicoccus chagannorensis]